MDVQSLTKSVDMDLLYLLQKLTIAVLIGMLIGIERMRKKKQGDKTFAGIRTFALISTLGFIAALAASLSSIVVYAIISVIFGVLISISYFFVAKKDEIGGTTEITHLIVYVLGSLVYWDMLLFTAILTVVIVVFLTFKSEFHTFAYNVSSEDIYATVKFAIITIIILPLLPDQYFGPFNVLNPRKIWYLVVLIAGISFVGYVLFKLVGTKKGIQLLSFVGGLVSSTALTLSFSQRSKEHDELSRNLAAGIIFASTIMFPRVLLVVFILSQSLAMKLALPFLFFTIAGIIVSLLTWRKAGGTTVDHVTVSNPFKLLFAVKFGLVFASVLFVSSAAKYYLGDSGIFYTGFIGGFANVDAVALSMIHFVTDTISLQTAAIAVILACLSNTIVKMLIAAFMGTSSLRRYTAKGFGVLVLILAVYLIAVGSGWIA